MKPLSIRARLTVWYTAMLALALGAFGVATWLAMRDSLRQAVDDDLWNRAESLRSFMDSPVSTAEMQEEFAENSDLGPGGRLVQVIDTGSGWTYRSPALLAADVAVPQHPGEAGTADEVLAGQQRLRTLTRRVHARGSQYILQVAAPVDEVYKALDIFRWTLVALIPPMLLLAATGGFWISRGALRPLSDLVNATESIDAEHLGKRLTVQPTGDEIQKLAETLNRMLGRLEASFENMARFTADASHELRTPVSLIRTASEVALRKARTPGEYQETLREIAGESERVTSLIADLLTLARADAGQDIGEMESIDLTATVSASLVQMQRLADASGVVLQPQAAPPLTIIGHRAALQRAVAILLDNAMKYSTPPGPVTISVRQDNGLAMVEVTDCGPGITPQDLPLIFERFYRADKARSRNSGGAGLGLAIARQIALQHGGRIEAESTPGKGSTFRLILPE